MTDLEERRYQQLRKLGRELEIPTLEAFLTLEVRDKNGEVIQRHRQRSHSWMRNAYNIIFAIIAAKNNNGGFGPGGLSLKDTGGAVRTGSQTFDYFQTSVDTVQSVYGYLADSGIDTFGILVGSGTNAENFEDYFLQTPITEGIGAGQLSHVASSTHSVSYESGTKTLKDEIYRFFNNNSGGDVNVNEVGLVAAGLIAGTNRKILTSRDRLASTITIPNTGQLKVTYTVQLTYPA